MEFRAQQEVTTQIVDANLARLERVRAAWLSGDTYQQIGEREGCTREYVRQLLHGAGLITPENKATAMAARKARRNGDALANEALIREAWMEGAWTVEQVAERTGLGRSYVNDVLRRIIPRDERRAAHRLTMMHREPDRVSDEEMLDSIRAAAAMLGIEPGEVITREQYDSVRAETDVTPGAIMLRFRTPERPGGWRTAVTRAGFACAGNHGRPTAFTDDECLAAFDAVAKQLGGMPPSIGQYAKLHAPGTPGQDSLRMRFKSWRGLIDAWHDWESRRTT